MFTYSETEATLHRADDHMRRIIDAIAADPPIAAVADVEGVDVVTRNTDDLGPFGAPVTTY